MAISKVNGMPEEPYPTADVAVADERPAAYNALDAVPTSSPEDIAEPAAGHSEHTSSATTYFTVEDCVKAGHSLKECEEGKLIKKEGDSKYPTIEDCIRAGNSKETCENDELYEGAVKKFETEEDCIKAGYSLAECRSQGLVRAKDKNMVLDTIQVEVVGHGNISPKFESPSFTNGSVTGPSADEFGYMQGGQYPSTFPWGAGLKARIMPFRLDEDTKVGVYGGFDWNYGVNNRKGGADSQVGNMKQQQLGLSAIFGVNEDLAVVTDLYWQRAYTTTKIEQAGSVGFDYVDTKKAGGLAVSVQYRLNRTIKASFGLGLDILANDHDTGGQRPETEWYTMTSLKGILGIVIGY
ncbi:MAG: hypothetical protein HYU98_06135 [Deltaproteobacteria bacterium]|nr:hypothetical protein [Deltaproteobacteria bacterium]